MCTDCGSGGLFGPKSQYIKTNNGDFIAIEGSDTKERQILSDLRIPYKQILKGRIILKPGQVNYLLNHLGMGDNATFLSIKATYDKKSTNEANNIVKWNYTEDYRLYSFAQLLVLTGNSTDRIKQIYLSNPNPNYPVTLEVMIAVIDDQYSFFANEVDQTGFSFYDLEYTNIQTYIVGDSVVINDNSDEAKPLVYINIDEIEMISRTGLVIEVVDSSQGSIFLKFVDEFNALQAHSIFTWIQSDPTADINMIDNPDLIEPVLHFYPTVGNTFSGNYIDLNGLTSSLGFNTTNGSTFSTTLSLTIDGGSDYIITKDELSTLLIDKITDNRGFIISSTSSYITISDIDEVIYSNISLTGSYALTFYIPDVAQNVLENVVFNLNVI